MSSLIQPSSSAGPSCKNVLGKGVLEILCMVLLLMPMAYIYVFSSHYDPFQRGFFCDDQNLKHPYLPQTVPIMQCVIMWAVVSVFFIVLVETLRSMAHAQSGTRRINPIPGSNTPWIAVELYRHFGYFSLGALTCLLFTEMSKYSIGRLRPHFLTLCMPNMTKELCHDQYGYKKYVTESEDIICQGLTQGTTTKMQLHQARLSFLSGHSSFSFYCAMFIIIYIQARLSNFPPCLSNARVRVTYKVLKILKPFIQFSLIILAFWISLTRISDYFHHPLDVATGALIGILFALVTITIIGDIFNKKKHSPFFNYNQKDAQQSSFYSNLMNPSHSSRSLSHPVAIPMNGMSIGQVHRI